jgi:hypothetical protein
MTPLLITFCNIKSKKEKLIAPIFSLTLTHHKILMKTNNKMKELLIFNFNSLYNFSKKPIKKIFFSVDNILIILKNLLIITLLSKSIIALLNLFIRFIAKNLIA